MTRHLAYLILGVGAGSTLAMLGLGLVLTHKASGVVNFAHAATGMWLAYVFYEFRETGDLIFPIPATAGDTMLGVEVPLWATRVGLLARPTVFTALAVTLVYGALLGALIYTLVFRRLRHAPGLSRVVASIGLFLYLYATAALRFPLPPRTRPILAGGSFELFGQRIFNDRIHAAAIAVGITAVLWAVYRFTRFGLATTAAAESEKGATLIGLDPDRLAAINWAIATSLAGLSIVLVARVTSLDPLNLSLLVVPALAAALLGGFRSFVWVAVAGFAVGMLQSELINLQSSWSALSGLGIEQGLPFVLILIALVIRGDTLPTRREIIERSLPESPTPRLVGLSAVAAAGIGVAIMVSGGSDWRQATITSSIAFVISLSIVVLTGYVGQISLAPYAFAGVAGFSLIKLGAAGVPFPLAPLAAALIAMLLGLVVGLPAVRVRGMNLAIATLGAAVAIEQLLFKWSWFTGDNTVPAPKLGGLDLSIAAKGSAYPRGAFGMFAVVVAVVCGLAVANLRRGTLGLRWLAVRSNERAAAAARIDVTATKLGAFALSAFLAGVGGVLIAYQRQTLSATSFQVFFSLAALAITYLAGIASISGAGVAGLLAPLGLFVLLTNGELPTEVSKYSFAANGLLLIVVAVALPNGITGAVGGLVRRLMRRSPRPVPATT
jgi:ABC-type branched-subunit amino acid transport system permease subunit